MIFHDKPFVFPVFIHSDFKCFNTITTNSNSHTFFKMITHSDTFVTHEAVRFKAVNSEERKGRYSKKQDKKPRKTGVFLVFKETPFDGSLEIQKGTFYMSIFYDYHKKFVYMISDEIPSTHYSTMIQTFKVTLSQTGYAFIVCGNSEIVGGVKIPLYYIPSKDLNYALMANLTEYRIYFTVNHDNPPIAKRDILNKTHVYSGDSESARHFVLEPFIDHRDQEEEDNNDFIVVQKDSRTQDWLNDQELRHEQIEDDFKSPSVTCSSSCSSS